MPERVVDRLEPVEVDEEHREPGPCPVGARQAVFERVGEQAAAGQAGERVVEGLVHRLLRLRVGDGQADVLGEDLQHLLVGPGVVAVRAVGRDHEAADHGAVLVDGRGHRRVDPRVDELRDVVW